MISRTLCGPIYCKNYRRENANGVCEWSKFLCWAEQFLEGWGQQYKKGDFIKNVMNTFQFEWSRR